MGVRVTRYSMLYATCFRGQYILEVQLNTSNSSNQSPCTARSEGDNKGHHDTSQVDVLVKKKKSPVESPSGLKQKAAIVVAGNCRNGDGMTRMLRRMQSDVAAKRDGMANAVVVKRVFRGKVRRYKLLDEVTS